MNIGIVGSGFMGRTHIEAYKNCGITNLFVCDSNYENAKKLADEFGAKAFSDFEEMLNSTNLDAVSICVPTPLHAPLTEKALEKGVAVLCEKPFASTVEEASSMIEKSRKTGVPLMVAHCLRFHKPYVYLKQALDDGRFGKLLSINMVRHSAMPVWSAGSWLANMEKSGGATVDLHVHETDMAVFLFGTPQAVTSVGDYKQCFTIYHYDDVAVSAEGSWRNVANYPFTSGYDANFENATVRFDGEKITVFDGENVDDTVMEKEIYPDYIKSDNPYESEIRYFLSNVESGEFDYCPATESLASTKTVYAELESLLSKNKLEIK